MGTVHVEQQSAPDFRALFEACPGLFLALTPELTIVAASDAYLQATMATREAILGRNLFDVFPENPDEPSAQGVRNLKTSLDRVRDTLTEDAMPLQRYDLRGPDGRFQERYWSPINTPVCDANGDLRYIVHAVQDVTDLVALRDAAGPQAGGDPTDSDDDQRAQQDLLRAHRLERDIAHRSHQAAETSRELKQTNADLGALLEAAPDAMVVVQGDGRIWRVNRRTEELLGYAREELIGQPVELLVPSGVRGRHPDLRAAFNANPHARPMGAVLDLRGRRKDGEEIPINVALSPVTVAGEDLVIAAIRDATERRALEEQLRVNAVRFRALFHEAPIGMSLTSLLPDTMGVVLDVNDALCRTLGYTREEILNAEPGDYVHEDDTYVSPMPRLASGDIDHDEFERRYITKHGEEIWLHVKRAVVTRSDGTPEYAVSHLEDVTLRRRTEAELAHAATHDPLTGLPNRTLLLDRLRQQLDKLARDHGSLAIFYIDLDRFKEVNDTLGHEAGDHLLSEISRRLKAAIRPGDTVARHGGDEFVVLGQDIGDEDTANQLARRILAELDRPLEAQGRTLYPGASIGVAITSDPTIRADDLLRRADQALYRAKAAGGGSAAYSPLRTL